MDNEQTIGGDGKKEFYLFDVRWKKISRVETAGAMTSVVFCS